MELTYHFDMPAAGHTGHTWHPSDLAGGDRDNLQGRSRDTRAGWRRGRDSQSPPRSICPGGPAWCGAPAGCRSGWGPPCLSAGPATLPGSTSSSSHLTSPQSVTSLGFCHFCISFKYSSLPFHGKHQSHFQCISFDC